MATIKFWQEMQRVVTIDGQDKLMIGKNSTGEAQYVNVEDLNQFLSIQGDSMPAITGGTTPATAVVLPTLGDENRYFDTSAGYWKYNNVVLLNPNGTEGIPVGSDGIVYWNGNTKLWSITKVQDLPIVPSDQLTEIPSPLSEITVNAILVEQGMFYKEKIEITSFPFVGIINSTNGVYTATAARKATDYIDITNYSHVIVNCNVINSATGTAFYDATNTFISGVANTGSEQILKKPDGAKYFRACSFSTGGKVWVANIIENKENQLTFVSDQLQKTFNIKQDAIEFMDNVSGERSKSIIYKEGSYSVKTLQIDINNYIAGFVNRLTGAFVTSSSYKVSNYLTITGYTHFLASGLASGSTAGIVFYDDANVYVGGYSLAADINTPYAYPIPAGATKVRHSIANTATTRVATLQNNITVDQNEIAFIEDGKATIYKGGGDSVPISGNELIADLPVSDGTGITIGYAYIDSVSGQVKVKI